jgi:hypothetical protein
MTGNTSFSPRSARDRWSRPRCSISTARIINGPAYLPTTTWNSRNFQILNESTAYSTINTFYNFTANAYLG